MKSMRDLLCILTAVVLAAFALPAAANKVYTFNLATTPSPLTAGGTGQSVTGSMNNISSDTGNSTIKSFKLFAPNGITITAPATGVLVPLGNGYTATIQNNGSSIYVSNINVPLKPFGTLLALSMTVDVSCSATTGTWTIQGPWNGGSFTGQTFLQQAPSNLTTNVNSGCTYSTAFQNQPKDAFAGYPITTTAFNNPTGDPIKVKYTLNGGVPPTTSVSLTSTSTCTVLSGNTALTDGSGIATFSNLKISTVADGCTLSASFGTSSDTSLPFDIEAPDGTLACNGGTAGNLAQYLVAGTIPPTGIFDWGLLRGTNWDDGLCGPDIPFTFDLDETNRTVTFTEDSLGQHPSVEYIIRWPAVDKDSDGWSGKQPCVSWGVTNPVYGTDVDGVCVGAYVPALACLADDVNGGAAVMPLIPINTYPFNAAVEDPYPQYQPGVQAKVCVAQQGWTSVGGQVQYWTKLIDQSDTGIRLP